MSLRQRLLGRIAPVFLVAAGLVGFSPVASVPGGAGTAAAQTVDTGLTIQQVYNQTLVGGFAQAGNTLLQCAGPTQTSIPGNDLTGTVPAAPNLDSNFEDGCGRDITSALDGTYASQGIPYYNDQVLTKFMDRDSNDATTSSSSATVDVPAGAQVVFAELSWAGSAYGESQNGPGFVPNPTIFTEPMKISVGDDEHYQSITPDQGSTATPGTPPVNTAAYYYAASADVTSLMAGRTGQITVWGADAPFYTDGFNRAGLGWHITVVYQYPSVDLTASPPHVAKEITVQEGLVYQQPNAPATNTVVHVPSITDATQVEVGLTAVEGDSAISGDTLAIDGHNITHPVTGETNNFFVSYAQGATDPNWTNNFSVDNVSWTLPPGIVAVGDTSMTLSTQSVTTAGQQDTFGLTGLATAVPVPAISLTKEVAPTYTTVGNALTYTFTVTNSSSVPIHGITVTDPLFGGDVPDCAHPAVLEPADSYQCTATHTITSGDIAAGHISNTATANALGENNEEVSDTASAETTTSTNLSITKIGSPKPVHVGQQFSYTITVTNNGPADAVNVQVTDPLPAGLTTPSAVVTQGATGSTAGISGGNLTATTPLLTHAAPNTFVVTVTGTIAANFTAGTISNTATVTAPNTNCATPSNDPTNCEATDETQVLQPAPITITKEASNATPQPGEEFTFTVQVTNTSDTTTANATVSDPIPADLTGATWTCAASTGSSCATASGTGDITNVGVTLAPLGVATFTITVTVSPSFQGGTITNTATATPGANTVCETDPTATSCPAQDSVTSTPEPAPITIEKSQAPATPAPGEAITYTVTVTNTSTSTIAHATLSDPVPAQIVATTGWSTTTTGTGTNVTPASATSGFPTGVALVIAPQGTVTFTIHAQVSPTYDGTQVTNVATATPGTNTVCEDSGQTCDANVSFANPAKLTIEKTHTPNNPSPVPGQQVTYHVTVTNPGNTAAGTGTFTDILPAQLDATTATWTCTPSAGSSCGAATGTGSPTAVSITVAPNGGTVTFTITATILPSETAVTVHNAGSVTPGSGTECADGQPTCEAEDTFTASPELAPLTITKSQTPTTPAAGQSFTYTVTVTNPSAFTTAHATFDDPVPAQVVSTTGWSTTTTGTGTTVAPPSATSGFPTAVTLTIGPGGTVTFTIHAQVSPSYNGTQVTNVATATPGLNTECADGQPTCSADVSFTNPAQLTVVKTHSPTDPSPVPGQRFSYTVTITNPGASATGSGTFTDTLPDPPLDAAGATWTCAASPSGTTPESTCGAASGTGSPSGVPITVAPNSGTVTFTITVTILPSETAVTVHNVGSVTPGTGTACLDGQPTCDGEDTFTATPETALLTIAKTHTPANPTPPAAGEAFTYTVVVTNTSAFTTAHATLADPVPAQVVPTTGWSTATTGTGTTVTPPSATSGFPAGVGLVIAPGGTVTFTIHAQVSPTYNGAQVTNVATATPGLNTGCADGQPTCQAEDSFINPARIEVAKTHSPTDPSPVPGQRFTYTVTVTNPGNSATASGTFTDALPDPPLDAAGATWTCTPSAGSSCGTATGTGSPTAVPITVAPNGGTVTFSIAVTILPSESPVTVHNVGSVTPGTGTECVDGQPTCDGEDTFTATPQPAPLTITKSQDPTTPAAGGAVTYTVTVTNPSDFTIAHATFSDPVPAQIVATTGWSTTTTGTGTTVTPAGATSGFPTGVTLVVAPGGSVTFTIHAEVSPTYNGTQVTNVATATPGLNTECADGQATCSADVSFANPAQLNVEKTHAPANPAPVPGQPITYTVTITNPGNSATASGAFSDPLPAQLDATTATWTCAASPSGTTPESTCGAAAGTGSPTAVAVTVAPNGGTVTFTITATILPSPTAVTVHNIGSVTPGPGTGCVDGQPTCDGEDTFTSVPPAAELLVEKSQDPATPVAGGAITYTVTVTNTSTTTQAEGTLDDPVPAQIVTTTGWSTTTTGTGTTVTPPSATSGFPTGVALVIGPSGTVTFTIHAQVSPTYNGTQVTNVATVTPGTNTSCQDSRTTCDASVSFANPAQLSVVKTHAPANPAPVPGQPVTYTVTITNPSASATASGTFSDPLPDPPLDAASATWTCTPSPSGTTPESTCGAASGSGSPAGVPITVAPNGGTVAFTITVTIRPSQVPVTVHNAGSVTPGPGTECVDGQPTCDGEDTFISTPPPATLTIAKAHAPASPTQGQAVTYTVTVRNTSTTTQAAGTVDDPFDSPALTGISWTAAGSGTGTTVTPESGTGPINGVKVTIPVGGVVTFTVHATVRSDWSGGEVINTSVVTPGENTTCESTTDPSCSDTNNFPTPSQVSIAKTHELNDPVPQPGQTVLYRVTVTNLSDQQAANVTLADPLPPALDQAAATWTTVTTGTGTTVTPASGNGPPNGVALTLAPGGTVTFVIAAQILPGFPGGTVTNTATITPGDNTGCGPEGCDASTSFEPDIPSAPLAIAKSATPPGPLTPGAGFTYTITVTNSSTTTVGHGTVTDAIPAGVIPGSWTATATPGSTVSPTSGTGVIASATVTVAPRGQVTFVRNGQVDPNFNSDFDIVNVATLTPGSNTHCDPTDPTQACDANAVLAVRTTPAPPVSPTAPPTTPVAPPTPILPGVTLPVTG